MKGLVYVFLFLLAICQTVDADEKPVRAATEQPEVKSVADAKDANEPNDAWWRRWDVAVKDTNDPRELLEAKQKALIALLEDKQLDQKQKEKIIDKIIHPVFDFELMSKLVLGRTHWPKFTATEQKRFTELFTERLKSSYMEKIIQYKNEKVLFKPLIQKEKNIQIPMVLVSDGQEVVILYKLRRIDERWKIYDVEIQGVSILLTYRSQFDDILRRGGVKDVFAQMEKPAKQ